MKRNRVRIATHLCSLPFLLLLHVPLLSVGADSSDCSGRGELRGPSVVLEEFLRSKARGRPEGREALIGNDRRWPKRGRRCRELEHVVGHQVCSDSSAVEVDGDEGGSLKVHRGLGWDIGRRGGTAVVPAGTSSDSMMLFVDGMLGCSCRRRRDR